MHAPTLPWAKQAPRGRRRLGRTKKHEEGAVGRPDFNPAALR